MTAFVCTARPRSVNAKGTATYQQLLRDAFAFFHEAHVPADEPKYGLAYYFHARPTELDADNLSKPIWDALEGLCYADDRSIRDRRSGTVDLRSNDFHAFNLSRLPDDVAAALINAIGAEDHILYVEFGALNDQMFAFGIEGSVAA
jgi:hypothetical protein